MILTDKCLTDFNNWLTSNNITIDDLNELVVLSLIEQWLNINRIYLIPCPVVGKKNGNDSYPIIGWRYDTLFTSKNKKNCYYMGYPVREWFLLECLDEGETFSDINIEVSDNLFLAKKEAIKEVNESYNLDI